MTKKVFGVSDVPCTSLEDDTLGIEKYVRGLEQFVLCCPTPMSIALQGDWGTGKTSFLQSMKSDFEKENKNIKTVYFNTWQYSQFKMSDDLYSSFISNIVTALGEGSEAQEGIKEVVQSVLKISKFFAKNYIKEKVNIDINAIEKELISREMERVQTVHSLKEQFAKIVDKAKGEDGRVVIFVDDLDRLNPEIAVELLEVMKLFMDVPSCVFVLAIDYEVVVSGVRKKFGRDMSEEKCRSFFDKIIQLPFRMPVDSYHIEKMLQNILNGELENYINAIGILIKNTLGANPRTLKRLSNSFFLLRMVEEQMSQDKKTEACQAALLFSSLVVQMYCYEAYDELIGCEGVPELKRLFESVEKGVQEDNEADSEKELEKIQDALASLSVALKSIGEINKSKADDIYEKLLASLRLSSITTVSSKAGKGEKTRADAMKVNRIVLDGTPRAVKNPTEAIVLTFTYVLTIHSARIKEFIERYQGLLTTDETAVKGLFRSKKPLEIRLDGNPLYLGTSSSSVNKMLQTKNLCDFMGFESGRVVWYDGAEVVFKN